MSKLATIEKVLSVKKHPNADRLKLVKILGWQCVTAEDYEIGDLVIYIPVDTTVPRAEWSSFLFKGDEERARIRSIRLRQEISQGLILPVSVLGWNITKSENGEYSYRVMNGYNSLFVGQDVTVDLGVEKYVKPISPQLAGVAKGDFPTHLVEKTDEIRLQSCPEVLDEMYGKPAYISIKLDGSSVTFIKDKDTLRVCSRNLELEENDTNSVWKMAKKYDLANRMVDGEVVQCEIVGPGIQKNTSGEKEIDVYAFNYGTIYGRQYFGFHELKSFCDRVGIKRVPTVGWYDSEVGFPFKTIEQLLELADTIKYNNGSQAEGIVIRPLTETYSDALKGRLSFKVISNNYAVKHGE